MILYFKVETNGELAGLFTSNSEELSAIEIAKIKMSQPELIVTQVAESEYSELLDIAMPETNSW